MLYYILLFIALILNAAANILIKVGTSGIGSLAGLTKARIIFGYLTNPYILIGLAIFSVNIYLYMAALSKINVSVAYPILTCGGLLIISLFAVFVFKETLSIVQIAGLALLALGIILVSLK